MREGGLVGQELEETFVQCFSVQGACSHCELVQPVLENGLWGLQHVLQRVRTHDATSVACQLCVGAFPFGKSRVERVVSDGIPDVVDARLWHSKWHAAVEQADCQPPCRWLDVCG